MGAMLCRYLWIWCLLTGVTLSASAYYSEDVNAGMSRLTIKCTAPERLRSLGFYACRCSMLVDKVLGIQTMPTKKLVIEERTEDSSEPSGQAMYVRVDVAGDEITLANDLFRVLIQRRIEEITGKPLQAGVFYELVAAGLTYRYVRGRHALSGYYEPDYEIARSQFMRKDFPRVDILLQTSIAKERIFFYELFMMHADLLLTTLQHGGENGKNTMLCKMLLAEQGGLDLPTMYGELTKSLRQPKETRQKYYERMVERAARRQRKGNSLEIIAERVRELETVPVLGIETTGVVKRVPLEDMPNVLKDYETDKMAVLRLEGLFKELRDASPYMLRNALAEYVSALRLIREGKMKDFSHAFGEARAHFLEAIERQRKLVAFMEQYESEHVPVLKRYVDYVQIIRDYRKQSDELYPTEYKGFK